MRTSGLVLAAAVCAAAQRGNVIDISVSECSHGMWQMEIPESGSGVIMLHGAEGDLYASLKALAGYTPLKRQAQSSVLSADFFYPFSLVWSDVAFTFVTADGVRVDSSAVHLATANTTERALAELELMAQSADNIWAFFGASSESNLGAKAFAFIMDPLGIIRSSLSEIHSRVVLPCVHAFNAVLSGLGLVGVADTVSWTATQATVTKLAASVARGGAWNGTRTTSQSGGIGAGEYNPHATVSPYATTALAFERGASKGQTQAAFLRCEVNPFVLRFPLLLLLGLYLSHASTSPIHSISIMYGSIAVMGVAMALFMLLSFVMNQRNNKPAMFGALIALVAGAFGHSVGLKALLAGTPLEPLVQFWPFLVILFIGGVTATTLCCVQRIKLEEYSVTKWMLGAILRVASAAAIANAFATPFQIIALPLILAVHGSNTLFGLLQAVETSLNVLVQWTLGWFFKIPETRIVASLRTACGFGSPAPSPSALALNASQGSLGRSGAGVGQVMEWGNAWGSSSGLSSSTSTAGAGAPPGVAMRSRLHSAGLQRKGSFSASTSSGAGLTGGLEWSQGSGLGEQSFSPTAGRLVMQMPDGSLVPVHLMPQPMEEDVSMLGQENGLGSGQRGGEGTPLHTSVGLGESGSGFGGYGMPGSASRRRAGSVSAQHWRQGEEADGPLNLEQLGAGSRPQ